MTKPQKHVFVCVQNRPPEHPRGSCASRGGDEVIREFAQQFDQKGLFGQFQLTSTGCLGPCDSGANLLVYPEGVMYAGVKAADVSEIIDEHLLQDKPVERLLMSADLWS